MKVEITFLSQTLRTGEFALANAKEVVTEIEIEVATTEKDVEDEIIAEEEEITVAVITEEANKADVRILTDPTTEIVGVFKRARGVLDHRLGTFAEAHVVRLDQSKVGVLHQVVAVVLVHTADVVGILEVDLTAQAEVEAAPLPRGPLPPFMQAMQGNPDVEDLVEILRYKSYDDYLDFMERSLGRSQFLTYKEEADKAFDKLKQQRAEMKRRKEAYMDDGMSEKEASARVAKEMKQAR
eukprot:Clim_evm2s234 gene=Clim_evmTU2s234